MRNLLLSFSILSISIFGQDPAARRADLAYIRNELPTRHPGFFAVTTRAEFEAAARSLESQADILGTEQFYVKLASLLATIRDAHTGIVIEGTPNFRYIPLLLNWFDDGVFVTAAEEAYLDLNAARLIAINGQPLDRVIDRLRPVISHENEAWFRHRAQTALANLGILRGIEIVPPGDPAQFTFRLTSGQLRTLPLGLRSGTLIRPLTQTPGFTPPTLRRLNEFYWAEYWPGSKTVYVAYRTCRESPNKSIAQFTAEITNLALSNPVDTMILDLRGNTGGNSLYFTQLLNGVSEPLFALFQNRQFRAFGLIDRGTFSSGLFAAIELKQPLSLPPGIGPEDGSPPLILVGEPTGGKPSTYGEVLPFTPPGSGFRGQHSTRFFMARAYISNLDSLKPDLAVSLHSTDYFARHDKALAAALSRSPNPAPPPSGDVIVVNAAHNRTDAPVATNSLVSVYGNFSAEPLTVKINDEELSPVAATQGQLTLLLPASTPLGAANITINNLRGRFSVAAAAPGIYVLEPANPLQPGAVVRNELSLHIFATGLGDKTQAWVAQEPAEILSIIPAPGIVGLWHVNVKLPSSSGQLPLFLSSGGIASNAVSIALP
jgi:uncharacterized protein (TIGR03437 family)